jgi:hypothetical protein
MKLDELAIPHAYLLVDGTPPTRRHTAWACNARMKKIEQTSGHFRMSPAARNRVSGATQRVRYGSKANIVGLVCKSASSHKQTSA